MSGMFVLKNKRTTLERAEKFISDKYFTDVNLRGRLYPDRQQVTTIYHSAAKGRIPDHEAVSGHFTKTEIGKSFGPTWATHWFKVDLDIPAEWLDKEVRLTWNSNSEAMVWREGVPLQGLNKENHRDFIISTAASSTRQTKQSLYIEMACNSMFGAGSSFISPPDPDRTFALEQVDLVTFDRVVYDLICDIQVLVDMVKNLPENDQRSYQALYTVNSMVNVCNVGDSVSYKKASDIAKIFFKQPTGGSCHTVHAMGHAHIDSAWLWPYAETVRKCARSWSTVVQLMERYQDYKFVCSQAQQYDWVRTNYRSLYEKIRHYVELERFIPVGGVWVEMDGQLPSGESFVRQFLYGQRFFQKEFHTKCDVLWLPDTFGYSAQLPQIVQEAGIKYFVTQKLSWNLVNKFPHSTFWWVGIDGSKCLTHFPPADDYGTAADVEEVLKTVNGNKDKGRVNHSMLLFGKGDGGGGPTEDMLNRLDRFKNVDGLPRVRQSTPLEFFESVVHDGTDNLSSWVGELYLELHQGTLTTQAVLKKYNRKIEFLLRNVELVHSIVLAGADTRGRCSYPDLDGLWRGFLLNQFHDVLPGSCIKQVVDDAIQIYKNVEKMASIHLSQGLNALADSPSLHSEYCIFNPNSWWRYEVVQLPGLEASDESRPAKVARHTTNERDSSGRRLVLVKAPPMAVTSTDTDPTGYTPVQVMPSEGAIRLENEHLIAMIGEAGRIISLVHKATGREAFKASEQECFYGNQFVMFDDVPLYWDAWDVMDYHLETRKPVSGSLSPAVILDDNPLRCSVKTRLIISEKSWIEQVISLDTGCPYVRFETKVQWQESHKFLKVEFPMNVRSPSATYEIQFGHIQRPTHYNTSWDWAKYEVCGHKWADLSEHGFGVSLLNDCKYGYSCHDNIMRLSLLRSPKSPDRTADMGVQQFTYAVMPHEGTFQESRVIQQAYNLNSPLVVFPGKARGSTRPYFTIDNPAVILETVKKSEDDNTALVLRLYEAYGGQARATITSPLPVSRAVRCNILEEPNAVNSINGRSICWTDSALSITLMPFQIVSLVLYLTSQAYTPTN